MVEIIEDKTGVMVSINHEGKLIVTKWKLPLDFRAGLVGWVMDFFRVLEEFSSFRLWFLRLILGRYAYRELIGMFEDLKRHKDWIPEFGYGLEDVDYNKEKVKLVFPSWREMYPKDEEN